jgi:hypothetical protein
MTLTYMEEYLNNVADGTDFQFTLSQDSDNLTVGVQGDNPAGEDWWMEFYIKYPVNETDLINNVRKEVWDYYEAFDIEEEVYLKLEAKRNGFRGVPDVVTLVHNEEYKITVLEELIETLVNAA